MCGVRHAARRVDVSHCRSWDVWECLGIPVTPLGTHFPAAPAPPSLRPPRMTDRTAPQSTLHRAPPALKPLPRCHARCARRPRREDPLAVGEDALAGDFPAELESQLTREDALAGDFPAELESQRLTILFVSIICLNSSRLISPLSSA